MLLALPLMLALMLGDQAALLLVLIPLLRALSPQLVLLRMLGCTELICAYSMLVGMVQLLLRDQLLDRYPLLHQGLLTLLTQHIDVSE